jgi:Domain of unknown function (DUF4383)
LLDGLNMSRNLAASTQTSEWTPARIFLLVSAIYHTPLGIVGLAMDQTFPFSSDAALHGHSERIFGLLETNGWHSLAALGLGLVSAFFALRPDHAREAALAIGIFHVGLVFALILWDPSMFLLASNAADQVIHSSTAIGGIVCGLLTPRRIMDSRRTTDAMHSPGVRTD